MSVAGYIGKNVKTPQNLTEVPSNEEPEVEALELDRETEAYRSVEDYDPVLRAHCRL